MALHNQQWNSAGLAAVHAAISAADAAIVASSGRRSASKDHMEAVELMRSLVPEAAATQERQLTGLLSMKNTIEYEQRLVTPVEAKTLTEQAGRLVRWATTVVADHVD